MLFKSLVVKELIKPVKDQKVAMNDRGFVPIKPLKFQSYSFELTKVADIYGELVKARVILLDSTMKFPKSEEIKSKKYCKNHYTFNHFITNFV